jgi:hypothetical protein
LREEGRWAEGLLVSEQVQGTFKYLVPSVAEPDGCQVHLFYQCLGRLLSARTSYGIDQALPYPRIYSVIGGETDISR